MRTIAHLSDLHFGRHDPLVCEALIASLNALSPTLVAVSGDLTQRARRREFSAARRFLDCITAPKLIVPGNHDIPLYNVFARLFAPLAKYERFVAPACLPNNLYADGEISVLGLSTVRRLTGKHGRISAAQIAHIRHVFEPASLQAFKVLVTHHPLGTTSDASLTLAGRWSLALRAIAAVDVHLLLSGHYHHTSHGVIDAEMVAGGSVLLVHAGTAISTRTRQEPNSYNLISIDGPGMSVTVMEWSPPAFRATATGSYALIDGRWRTVQRPSC